MTMFLSIDELRDLTGKKTKTSQLTALRFMGIEHKVRPDGSLAVLRSHIEAAMGVAQRKERKFEPNWDAINA